MPKPDPQYWQNVPEAPIRELHSEASRGHLACCNLQSSMLQHQDERGRAAYACSAGETWFWRRQPHKLASTLAFMLGEQSAEFERLRGAEVEPLRECLQYLRVNNPHLRVHLSNAERFVKLYGELQAVVPRGRGETQVRLQRTRQRPNQTATSTLADTLGAETDVLVVVDPRELPRNYATVDLLAEQVGDACYRVAGRPAEARSAASMTDVTPSSDPQLPPDWGRAMSEAAQGLKHASPSETLTSTPSSSSICCRTAPAPAARKKGLAACSSMRRAAFCLWTMASGARPPGPSSSWTV